MTRKSSPFTLQRPIDTIDLTERREMNNLSSRDVVRKMPTYYAKIGGAGAVHVNSIICTHGNKSGNRNEARPRNRLEDEKGVPCSTHVMRVY